MLLDKFLVWRDTNFEAIIDIFCSKFYELPSIDVLDLYCRCCDHYCLWYDNNVDANDYDEDDDGDNGIDVDDDDDEDDDEDNNDNNADVDNYTNDDNDHDVNWKLQR